MLRPLIGGVHLDLFDRQGAYLGVLRQQLDGDLRLGAEVGTGVGEVQSVNTAVLIAQVTDLEPTLPIEVWPRAADLSLRLEGPGQGCRANQELLQPGEISREGVLQVHGTGQSQCAACARVGDRGIEVEALHLETLVPGCKGDVRGVHGNVPQV